MRLNVCAGAKFMTDDEAVQAGEKNMRQSHATHDLYNAIAEGDFPEWTWCVRAQPLLALPFLKPHRPPNPPSNLCWI